MWISAWILVASGALYQPTYPPFLYEVDCEKAREVYLKSRSDSAAKCVKAMVFK